MAARVQLSPGATTNIAKALKVKAEITIRREAARVAELAVVEAQRIARAELYIDRPANRRSRPGSKRYLSSFSAKVTSTTFPIKVELKNGSKIAHIIEHGSSGHTIRAKGDKRLALPYPASAHSNAYGSSEYKRPQAVSHPGTEAKKIMERALKEAFKKRGASIRATR